MIAEAFMSLKLHSLHFTCKPLIIIPAKANRLRRVCYPIGCHGFSTTIRPIHRNLSGIS